MATSLTNIAAKTLPDADLIIAAYGVVQRLILIGCYVIMGFMQGYQPVASYAFGPKNEERFNESAKFAFKGSLLLTIVVAVIYIALAKPLILLFNRNPLVVEYGKWLFLSLIRQCLFYVPFILSLPGIMGVKGIYFSQPAADILTIIVCIALIKPMKRDIIKNMKLDAKYN